VQSLIADLNRAYREIPALHQRDCEPEGFEWLELHDAEQSVLAFMRKGKDEARPAVVVSNFTPVPRENYRIGVPQPGFYQEQVNTDAAVYGGGNIGNGGGVHAAEVASHGRPYSLELTIPPLATVILERTPDQHG
jgi:1,4-alpha-glucan branching enzyme